MSQYRLKREEADKRLSEALAFIPREVQNMGASQFTGPVSVPKPAVSVDWLITEILRREAVSLFEAK
jgi:hypothetical protein